MANWILNNVKKIPEVWKISIAIFGITSFIVTAAIKTDHWLNKKAVETSKIEHSYKYDYADSVRTKDFQDTVIANFKRLAIGQERTWRRLDKFSVEQDSLKSYFMRKAVTKQDMKDIINIWGLEKKNEDNSFSMTVHNQNK